MLRRPTSRSELADKIKAAEHRRSPKHFVQTRAAHGSNAAGIGCVCHQTPKNIRVIRAIRGCLILFA
jgi:hypothetical protein